jgi:hypothetical protein
MTQFLFNVCNHNLTGQRSLEDPMGIFGHQLRALGHNAVWRPENDQFLMADSGINVVIEGFTEYAIKVIGDAYDKGARFICVATEEPTPRGFNHGRDREMVRRQEMFPHAAKYFEAIFHLVPGDDVTRWFNQFAPSAYVELGYAKTLVRGGDNIEPTHDFGFFGSLTPRRLKILKRLAKFIQTEKAIRVEATFPDQGTRDRIMRQAKVIVQIRKFEEMGLVSSSRCNTALCLGRPVVAEPHLLSKPWDEIVKFSASLDAFYNDCLMARSAWRGVHAAQFDRFKTKLTPEFCVQRAFDQIGFNPDVLDKRRNVA